MDAAANPFDNIEPHRLLPEEARKAFWSASQLVLTRPNDFAEALAWLDAEYSEPPVRERCEQEYRRGFRAQLLSLRRDSRAYQRKLAIHLATAANGPWPTGLRSPLLEEVLLNLRRERVWEALHRGQRLDGTQLVQRPDSNDPKHPDDKVITQANVHLVFACDDEQYRRNFRKIRAEQMLGDNLLSPAPEIRRKLADLRLGAVREVMSLLGLKKSRLDSFDHPGDRGWRIERALTYVREKDLPAGKDEGLHARRVVLLACLVTYQHVIPLHGEFCTWAWDDVGNYYEHMLAQAVRAPLPVYVPGRNTVLFGYPDERDEEKDYLRWNTFADLVRRAVGVHAALKPARRTCSKQAGQRRRRRRLTIRLTAKQLKAVELYGQHHGDKSAAAAAMGVSRPTYYEHLEKADKKIPGVVRDSLAGPCGRTQALPHDHRGNVDL